MARRRTRIAPTSEARLDELMAKRRWCFYLDATAPDPSNQPGQEPRYRVSIVIEGNAGHYPTGGDQKDFRQPWYWTEEVCRKVNEEERGLSERDVFEITVSSMNASAIGREQTIRSAERGSNK